jgi:uncharacterized protein YjbJ (UPF0337 family)
MNKDEVQGKWHQMKGALKAKWGKLTDDDLARFDGNFEKLAGVLQERYGYAREQAEKAVKEFEHHQSETAKAKI